MGIVIITSYYIIRCLDYGCSDISTYACTYALPLIIFIYFSFMSSYSSALLFYFLTNRRLCPCLRRTCVPCPSPWLLDVLLLGLSKVSSKIPWSTTGGETWTHDLSWMKEVSCYLSYGKLLTIEWLESSKDHLAHRTISSHSLLNWWTYLE